MFRGRFIELSIGSLKFAVAWQGAAVGASIGRGWGGVRSGGTLDGKIRSDGRMTGAEGFNNSGEKKNSR